MPSDEDFIFLSLFSGVQIWALFLYPPNLFGILILFAWFRLYTLFFRFDSLVLSSLKKIIFLCRKEEMFYALI